MNPTRHIALAPRYSLAFLGLTLSLLLLGCSQEQAGSPGSAPPPPPAPSPPLVEAPSREAAQPEPVADHVIKVVKDRSGRHTAQVVLRDQKQVVVRDGRPGPEYDRVGEVTFSADGKSLAYEAQQGKEHLMVLDDREWPLKAEVVQDSFRVSPDNQRLALVARHQNKWQVMVDGRPDPPFDFIFIDTLKFSPSGAHTGYLALKGAKLAAVVDGRVRGQWDVLPAGDKALQEALCQADTVEVPRKGEEKKE